MTAVDIRIIVYYSTVSICCSILKKSTRIGVSLSGHTPVNHRGGV